MLRKDGPKLTIVFDGKIGYDEHGKFKQTHCILQNITERKKAEDEIRALLREKELLLKEIEHRVKNNLQVISSLLDMTMMMASNQEAAELLEDVRSKVLALGLVHSRLYEADSLDQIDMDAYILEHVSHLKRIYETRGKSITHVMEPSGVYLSVNQAVPCALVLNKVISNSFKHAFEGREGYDRDLYTQVV